MYARRQEADAAFCFTVTKRTKTSWLNTRTWCDVCGYDIPYGERIVVEYDDHYGKQLVAIYHEECYATR